jgi:hypothetical protein
VALSHRFSTYQPPSPPSSPSSPSSPDPFIASPREISLSLSVPPYQSYVEDFDFFFDFEKFMRVEPDPKRVSGQIYEDLLLLDDFG